MLYCLFMGVQLVAVEGLGGNGAGCVREGGLGAISELMVVGMMMLEVEVLGWVLD